MKLTAAQQVTIDIERNRNDQPRSNQMDNGRYIFTNKHGVETPLVIRNGRVFGENGAACGKVDGYPYSTGTFRRKPLKVVKPAYSDPDSSVDLFDGNRKNDEGEMYCVAPAILETEVDAYWECYLKFPDAIMQEF